MRCPWDRYPLLFDRLICRTHTSCRLLLHTHKKTTYSKSEPLAWDSTARVRGLYLWLSGGPEAPHHNHLTTAHQYL